MSLTPIVLGTPSFPLNTFRDRTKISSFENPIFKPSFLVDETAFILSSTESNTFEKELPMNFEQFGPPKTKDVIGETSDSTKPKNNSALVETDPTKDVQKFAVVEAGPAKSVQKIPDLEAVPTEDVFPVADLETDPSKDVPKVAALNASSEGRGPLPINAHHLRTPISSYMSYVLNDPQENLIDTTLIKSNSRESSYSSYGAPSSTEAATSTAPITTTPVSVLDLVAQGGIVLNILYYLYLKGTTIILGRRRRSLDEPWGDGPAYSHQLIHQVVARPDVISCSLNAMCYLASVRNELKSPDFIVLLKELKSEVNIPYVNEENKREPRLCAHPPSCPVGVGKAIDALISGMKSNQPGVEKENWFKDFSKLESLHTKNQFSSF